MTPVLHIEQLTKRYGRLVAVDHLDLQVPAGTVFGLLGPNGSGKTSTLGMVLDVVNRTSGSYRWFGQEPAAALRQRIGAILEHPVFFPYMTGAQNLRLVATIKRAPLNRIPEVLELVDLADRQDDRYKTYSLGMKQRLSVAAALLSDPEVLVLDEPTNGLDPQGITDVRELIRKIADQGKTIILASHLLDEVQKVCSHFAVLRKGKLIHQGEVADINADPHTVEVRAEDMSALQQALTDCPLVHRTSVTGSLLEVKLLETANAAALNAYLFEKGVILTHLNIKTRSLEKAFLEILQERA